MSLRKYLPPGFRLFVKLSLRRLKDFRTGEKRLFNSRERRKDEFAHAVSVVQVIRMNANFENKVHNLQKGIDAISGVVIQPGEIFSFWNSVGRPNQKNGFKLSRNLVSGQVSEDYGGGLCQLSSIIYHASLLSGLAIKERFNHSIDIYREEDRFTPLGADATVVYGYKDLRIQNPFRFPVMIALRIEEGQLQCNLSGEVFMESQVIDFQRKEFQKRREVLTVNGLNETLAKSVYLKPAVEG